MMRRLVGVVLLLLTVALPCSAKTLVVTGRLSSEVTVTQSVTFGVDREISELVYRFPLPAKVAYQSTRQKLADHRLSFSPQPESVREEVDSFGNHFQIVTWRGLTRDARAQIVFTTDLDAQLDPIKVNVPFPLPAVADEAQLYLKATPLVQSDAPEIVEKAGELTAGAVTEAAAVDAIVNFVTDHIRYETPPKSYDALYGLTTGTGNCQNYAHLACALLRASGIPARVAVGLTLKEKWKIPLDDKGSFLAQGMGEGLHAWLEVWFPGVGWLPCDPQQSKQFTSTRHIKYAHGPEVTGIGTTWRGTPVLPRYDSVLSSSFSRDVVELKLKSSGTNPHGYMSSNEMIAVLDRDSGVPLPVPVPVPPPGPLPVPVTPTPKPAPAPLPKPRPKPVYVKPKPPVPAPADREGVVVIGNARLPKALSLYTVSGNSGEAALERETAEYVTSSSVYAQAFVLERPLRVEKVSLAMKKFGGDGTVYLDIVADEKGKPGMSGVRSMPIYLERVRRLPTYAWLDFTLPSDATSFVPGKYWIVLRRSGEAIMNWFYTPGKPYGGPDDTRSTARGWQWEDILTYDFVFKVAGRELKKK